MNEVFVFFALLFGAAAVTLVLSMIAKWALTIYDAAKLIIEDKKKREDTNDKTAL